MKINHVQLQKVKTTLVIIEHKLNGAHSSITLYLCKIISMLLKFGFCYVPSKQHRLPMVDKTTN